MFSHTYKNFCLFIFIFSLLNSACCAKRVSKIKAIASKPSSVFSDYVSLSEAVRGFGFSFFKKFGNNVVYKDNKNRTLDFSVGTKQVLVNNTKIFLAQPIKSDAKSNFSIARVDINKTLTPILLPDNLRSKMILQQTTKKSACKVTVVIDPGHGGRAKGTENKAIKLVEKDLALLTAIDVKNALIAKGVNAILTRSADVNIGLDDRAKFSNKNNADVFVSIHYNHSPSATACGVETYASSFLNNPSTDRAKVLSSDRVFVQNNLQDDYNTFLGFCVQSNVSKATSLTDRGLRRSRFAVLKNVNAPAILIECGFFSNNNEAKLLATTEFRRKLANGIAAGIMMYVNAVVPNYK